MRQGLGCLVARRNLHDAGARRGRLNRRLACQSAVRNRKVTNRKVTGLNSGASHAARHPKVIEHLNAQLTNELTAVEYGDR
jgi:hypothetical protein